VQHLLGELVELRRAQHAPPDRALADQPLLQLLAAVVAGRHVVDADDREGDVVPDPGGLLGRQQGAGHPPEEGLGRRLLLGADAGHVDDRVDAGEVEPGPRGEVDAAGPGQLDDPVPAAARHLDDVVPDDPGGAGDRDFKGAHVLSVHARRTRQPPWL
jgi:hypothetical protein